MGIVEQGVAEMTQHGSLVLFIWVTAETLGVPMPAVPILVAAGVLSATGQMSLLRALVLGTLGCLIGDVAWFGVGKWRGAAVLRLLCKISLEPESCVRRTSGFISRHGGRSLLFAKFIPGISAVAVPLAATSGMSLPSFLVHDALGTILYVGGYVALGRIVADRIDEITLALRSMSNATVEVAVLAAAAILAWRLEQRRRFHRAVRMARITVEELRDLIARGENPLIIDLRHTLDALSDSRVIPGAIRLSTDELSARQHEIPRDREIVLYCT